VKVVISQSHHILSKSLINGGKKQGNRGKKGFVGKNSIKGDTLFRIPFRCRNQYYKIKMVAISV